MADSDLSTPRESPTGRAGEPDVGRLVIGIAAAALSTVVILAIVATQSIGYIVAGGLVPVAAWGFLLREIHKILRFNGADDPDGEWLNGDEELWGGRVAPDTRRPPEPPS